MEKPIVYLDLDGVLADFDKAAGRILGTDNIYKFEFVYGPKAFWKGLNSHPDFFSTLEVKPGAWRLLSQTLFHPRSILTALPKINAEYVNISKRAWVREHFGPLHVITCETNDKPNYCEPGDILVDDRAVNKAAWEARGGRYIIHTDTESTLEQLKSLGVTGEP